MIETYLSKVLIGMLFPYISICFSITSVCCFYLLFLTIIEIGETANTGILTELEKWLVFQVFVSAMFHIYHLLMLLKKEKQFVIKEY